MRLMSLTAILAGTATLCAVVAVAEEDRVFAIQSVISSQLEAFRSEDVERAFDFASPGIRQLFGTSSQFGAMVQSGYPMVWRPGTVDYLGLRDEGDRVVQRVMVRDLDGAIYVLDYEMVQHPGGWQIDGVRLLAGGVGA